MFFFHTNWSLPSNRLPCIWLKLPPTAMSGSYDCSISEQDIFSIELLA